MKTVRSKNGKAKNLNENDAMYSSTAFKPLLLNKSANDSKIAVKNANINAIMGGIMCWIFKVDNYFLKIINNTYFSYIKYF